jgi:xylan 1,4-beta-xylosidase
MGSPLLLSDSQFSELEKAGQLAEVESPINLRVKNRKLDLKFNLPRQAVSLFVIEWN